MGIQERRIREKHRRTQDIVDSAEEVIFKKGVRETTMEDIAKKAELGKSTLYNYFKSKDEILAEIHKRASNLLTKEFREASEAQEKGYQKIEAIGQAFFEFKHKYPNYFQFISLFESQDTAVNTLESKKRNNEPDKILQKAIRVGIEDGTIKDVIKPHVLSKMLWAMSTGVSQFMEMQMHILEQEENISSEEMHEATFTFFREAMRKI